MLKADDLKGKVAIVTGGSRGLGKAMAIALAENGCKIVIADILMKEAEQTAQEISNKYKVEVMPVKVDVSSSRSVNKLVYNVAKKFGKIDILVNNAGILRMGPSETIPEKEWDIVISVNLKGQFLCAQTVGREMIKQKSGAIINIASIAGQFGFPQAAAYDSSKGGVILLTKALAAEWAKYNIRVNCIAPGVFETPMTADFLKSPQFMQNIKQNVPMGRAAQPSELAGAVVYLASKESSYMTGNVLVIDGGWTAGL